MTGTFGNNRGNWCFIDCFSVGIADLVLVYNPGNVLKCDTIVLFKDSDVCLGNPYVIFSEGVSDVIFTLLTKVLQSTMNTTDNVVRVLGIDSIARRVEVPFNRLRFAIYLIILKLKMAKSLYTSIGIMCLLLLCLSFKGTRGIAELATVISTLLSGGY